VPAAPAATAINQDLPAQMLFFGGEVFVKNSEIQSSPAAPGYRQSRHKRKTKTLRTRWLPPVDKSARKRKSWRETNLTERR
jgi:hypothetical protein